MAHGKKRKHVSPPSSLKESLTEDVADKETHIKEDLDDEEEEDDDSSVYSELEDEEDDDDEEEEEGEGVGEDVYSSSEKEKVDEYEEDSSDEEDARNTIGNVPLRWYEDYSHVGYDLEGNPVKKPVGLDELDKFLSSVDNPDDGVTVLDPMTGQNVVLSPEDIQVIKSVREGKIPDPSYDYVEPWVPFFSADVRATPICAVPEPKAAFIPSNSERLRVGKMVHSIKMGWMKTNAQMEKEAKEKESKDKYYMLWKTDDQLESTPRDIIPAPKMKLPGHAESYNPPPEYLFTEKEKQVWEEQDEEPYKRKLNFIPQKFSALRKVPAYKNFIQERFERCMDLHLAPRARKMRLTIQPEDLVPTLPNPKDLMPFPQVMSLTYFGHKNMIRTMSIEPKGQFLASGSDDKTVKIWEVQSGYCLKTFKVGGVVKRVSWCPNSAISLITVAVENRILLINTGLGDETVVERTTELLKDPPLINDNYIPPEKIRTTVKWELPDASRDPDGTLVVISHFKPVKTVVWHGKGDYFSVVLSEGQNRSVFIHQLSKWRSQLPFNKSKGLVQTVQFHPTRPYFFVATQRHVRLYDLIKQKLAKKLMTNSKWISSLSIHPHGDNLLIGTYDKRVQWFDLDLSTAPYQVLRYHTNAVRGVAYHRRYPLFASCSDDTSIIVSHGMVYNDLLQNPLIVPLKQLRGHTKYDDFGVMDVVWHPTQPWLFSSGADGYIRLWT